MKTRDYIEPCEATRIRVFREGRRGWAIDAADGDGLFTDSCWNRDGEPDRRLTLERAKELVPEFVAHLGLPSGLPVEVWELDHRLVEVIPCPRA
jgi:hypothetical protein